MRPVAAHGSFVSIVGGRDARRLRLRHIAKRPQVIIPSDATLWSDTRRLILIRIPELTHRERAHMR
jgi:hypothetical protein